MKNPNLDELNEEELKEYLEKNAEEDLKADVDDPKQLERDMAESVTVAAEIEMPAPKKRDRLASKEEREKRALERQKEKEIKERRKYLKKNPTTLVRYDIDPEIGLTDEIVASRTVDELVNKVKTKSNRSIPKIIFKNVVTFFNILIFFIAGVLIAVGAPVTDFVFLVIVTINIVIGIVQEINAKNMIDKLSLISAPTAFVKRSGIVHEIAVEDVVLDDCLLLENGRQICADSIVLEGNIEVNESLLTGESDAILKKPGDVLYSGSYVVSGKCSARVDKVGKDNYIEKLSNQAKAYKAPKSDLYSSLNKIIKFMTFPVVICGASIFAVMYFQNNIDLTTSVRKTAGAMIGMIPSGLFLMSTVALYVGVIRLGQRNVLVQDLYCIEMLARVNCICLDKTGTITDGTMQVKNVIDYNNVHGLATRNIISAMLNALQDNNLTSQALKDKFGLGKRIKHTAKIPFSSSRKYQAVTFDRYGTFALGAPEFVLKNDFKRVEKDVNKYAALGYRVLCLAHKEGTIEGTEMPEGPIEILSMILIEDNIRPDAINTIRYFKESGVEVRVISGDNPITVSKIAQRAGVSAAERYVSLDGKSESDVINEVRKGTTVFGRVSPEQKKLIIRTLKDLGKTVAMTGDGVNDILALKEADCSIAVASGSQAVRNCSHLVLMDSNFDSMPSVVSEGRRVINNVSKVAALFLTKTIFSLFLAIEAIITGNYPIATSQLIIIEAFAIGIPSIVLVNEPNNRPVKGRFLYNVLREALPGALVILIISLIVFGLTRELNLDTVSFTTIIVIAATHTCMMVLFKVCHPFTTIHKALCTLCYSMFIIIVVALPQFLELRPIFKFAEYYSNSVSLEYLSSYPSVERSNSNYYVIDGKVINLQKNNNNTTITLTCEEIEDELYYAINGEVITKELNIPDLSYSNKGEIYMSGYKVNNLKYTDDFASSLAVDSKGNLVYREVKQTTDNKEFTTDTPIKITLTKSNTKYGYEKKYGQYSETLATYQYNVLPSVKIENREYIIDGVSSTNYKYMVPVDFDILEDMVVSINPENKHLLINGKEVYPTSTLNGQIDTNSPYVVAMPTVSTNPSTGTVYLNAVDTGFSVFEIFGEKNVVDGNNTYTILDKDGNGVSYVPSAGKILDSDGQVDDRFVFDNIGTDGFKEFKNPITQSSIKVENLVLTAKSNASAYSIMNGTIAYSKATNMALDNVMICPEIAVTSAGKCIINGYYTEFEFASGNLDPHVDAKNNLVLGGITTDYQVSQNNVVKETGGMVSVLSVASRIFLLMLCLMAGPLMKILQNSVPWIKKNLLTIRNLLTKIQ